MDRPTKKSIRQMVSVDEIHLAMCHVFQEAQLTLSGHRKLVIIMKTIFDRAVELEMLHEFGLIFAKLVNKVLDLKKGEKAGDRIAKFCSSFIAIMKKDDRNDHLKQDKSKKSQETIIQHEKEQQEEQKLEQEEEQKQHEQPDEELVLSEDEEDDEDTCEDIFITMLINHLLRGIKAKDKNVRYRVVQILAYLVYYIGELDHDTFQALYTSLSERIHDREPYVRIQAIVALSRFQVFDLDFTDADFDIEISRDLIIKNISSCLIKDESAEVRRAALLNLEKTNKTIPLLIQRARDNNNINRRLVYSRISRELGNFQNLKPSQIENLLKWGLNDRDSSVRDSAIKMLCSYWYEASNENLLQLIHGLNVTVSEIADLAMSVFFTTRQDTLSSINFNEDEFWNNLTIEKSFLMRTFYDFCNQNKLYELIDANFPEPLVLATILQNYFNLRNNLLSNNHQIVKKLKSFENKIEKLNNAIFSAENKLIKLNFDNEHAKVLLLNDLKELEFNEGLAEVIGAKLDGLNLEDDFDVDDNILEELNELSNRDLKKKVKQTKHRINDIKKMIHSRKELIREIEEEFNAIDQEYTNSGNQKIQEVAKLAAYTKEVHEFDSQLKTLEYIILQLLLVSKDFDFGDEMGRRKMLQLIRSSLSGDKLTDSITNVALKVLRNISLNEKDFISMATEIITDVRDSYEEDDTFHSAHSEIEEADDQEAPGSLDNDDSLLSIEQSTPRSKRRRTEAKLPPDDIVLHCLIITQHLLEIMEEPLENNISLESIYSGLVNYAITCIEKYSLHLMGLKCLGLFSLIDVKIARNGCSTFYTELKQCGEKVRIISIKALVDILSMYGVSIIENNGLHIYAKLLHRNLNEYSMPKLQCVAAEGLCKLFLADVFGGKNGDDSEKELFESLILAYFNPKTQNNNELRQILAFCLPVYAFSHPKHQYRIATISGDCLYRLSPQGEREGVFTKDSKITANNVVQELIHWCDPNNLINLNQTEIMQQTSHFFQTIYFLQAIEQNTPKSVKKAIINNLGKMFITEELESKLLQSLVESIEGTRKFIDNEDNDPEFSFDKTTLKNFDNFENYIKETFNKSLERERRLEITSVASSRIPSRTNSIVGFNMKIENASKSKNSLRNSSMVKEEDIDDLEKVMQSVQVKGNADEIDSIEEPQQDNEVEKEDQEEEQITEKQKLIEENLKDIDQILEDEDAVEYDISMDDI